MPTITLPDGNNLDFPKKTTGKEIAEKISKSLAKDAIVISVNGELKDLDHLIEDDCSIKIFTSKNKEGLETIRHDTAHILAMAVQELFPGTQVTIGPVIENGFYYDFARKEPFTEEDLKKIEDKMKQIVDRDEKTKREIWNRDKAIKHFKKKVNYIKQSLLKVSPRMKKYQSIFMVNGTIYVEGHIYLQQEKLENFLNLQKSQVRIGEATRTMKCFKEYMVLVGQIRKI